MGPLEIGGLARQRGLFLPFFCAMVGDGETKASGSAGCLLVAEPGRLALLAYL